MNLSFYEWRRVRCAARAADELQNENGIRRLPLGTRHALRHYDFCDERLDRRRAGDSMTADGIEAKLLIFGDGKSRYGDWRLRFYLGSGLRYGDMAGVADLAMLLVGGVPVPVPCSLHGKEAHGENQRHRQQS